MLSKRLIACLDVRDGKLAKSIKFVDTKDIGDPVEKAREYYEDGLDELVFYDITASSDRRDIMIEVVEAVASQIFRSTPGTDTPLRDPSIPGTVTEQRSVSPFFSTTVNSSSPSPTTIRLSEPTASIRSGWGK